MYSKTGAAIGKHQHKLWNCRN